MVERETKAKGKDKKPGDKPPKPPDPGAQATDPINLTDEESRIMPVAGGGFAHIDHAQAAVGTGSLPVVPPRGDQAAHDEDQAAPMRRQLATLPERLGQADRLLADTGFCRGKNVKAGEVADIEPLLP